MEQNSNKFKEEIVFAKNCKSSTTKNKRGCSPLLSIASCKSASEISFETHSQILASCSLSVLKRQPLTCPRIFGSTGGLEAAPAQITGNEHRGSDKFV